MGCRIVVWLSTFVVVAEMMSLSTTPRAQETRAPLPPHLSVHPVLRPFVQRMWDTSPTFRGQCRRLMAGGPAHVRLLLDDGGDRPGHFRARTTITDQRGLGISAAVSVKSSPEAMKLIATRSNTCWNNSKVQTCGRRPATVWSGRPLTTRSKPAAQSKWDDAWHARSPLVRPSRSASAARRPLSGAL